MIYGYFWKDKGKSELMFLSKKAKHFFIPFVFYFVVLDLIPMIFLEKISLEKVLKRCFAFVWSGKLYQGVYWFIPTLFLSVCIFCFLRSYFDRRKRIMIMCCMYVLGIVISIKLVPECVTNIPLYLCLPWNADVCLLTVGYIGFGLFVHEVKGKINLNIKVALSASCLFLSFLFIILYITNNLSYKMDMKYSMYKSIIFPIILPITFGKVIQDISVVLNNFIISKPLLLLGKASLIVMYIHIPIRKYIFELFRINYNPYVYAITCAVIGCCLYMLIQNNKARVIFLG